MTNQQMNIPGIDPPPTKAGQHDNSHAEERRYFEHAMGGTALADVYLDLLNEGWFWRDAVYIAWKQLPKPMRVPATVGELEDMVGCSRGMLKKRANANPALRARLVKGVVVDKLLGAIEPILDQSISVATHEGRDGFNDRRMLLEMSQLYKRSGDGVTIVQTNPSDTTVVEGGVGDMEAELARLTGGES